MISRLARSAGAICKTEALMVEAPIFDPVDELGFHSGVELKGIGFQQKPEI
jgi:hypothetical protein